MTSGRRCGQCDGCRWDGLCILDRLYTGDAFVNLHPEGGTTWRKDPDGQYWPDCCDLHRPESKRQTPAAALTPRKPKRAPAVKSDGLAANPDEQSEPITDEMALRLLRTWLKRLAGAK